MDPFLKWFVIILGSGSILVITLIILLSLEIISLG